MVTITLSCLKLFDKPQVAYVHNALVLQLCRLNMDPRRRKLLYYASFAAACRMSAYF